MRVALLLLLASLAFFPAQAQMPEIRLNPVEQPLDSVKHFKKILIVGEGNIQAHAFVDMLAEELIKGFEKKDIECKYQYLGDKSKVNTVAALENAKRWEHDVVLHLNPISNTIDSKREVGFAPINLRTNNILFPFETKTNQYVTNDFELLLEENNAHLWFSTLSIESKFGKKNFFKKLRMLILADMERQLVLPS